MHEFSIMQSALEQTLAKAREAGARRVHEVRLRIGALSGVVPEALRIAFEALTIGTVAQQAVLKIEDVPARYWCVVCDREFPSEKLFAECPNCHSVSRELRAGRELELASMEIT
jgi:hydrogenase nickel incorporation protein HypA/HybF